MAVVVDGVRRCGRIGWWILDASFGSDLPVGKGLKRPQLMRCARLIRSRPTGHLRNQSAAWGRSLCVHGLRAGFG